MNILDTARVNRFAGTTDPAPINILSLAGALHTIEEGIYQQRVQALRTLLQTTGKPAYDLAKRQLDAVTFCGTFSPTRAKANLLQHNGIVHGDLDHLPDLDATRQAVCSDPHTVYCFVSPSGTGLKIGVRVEPVPDDFAYKHAWQVVADYYYKNYGVQWDPSGKDISRLCFVSWDPECYVNPDAALFPLPAMIIPPPRPQTPRPRDIPADRHQQHAHHALEMAVKIIDTSAPGTRHHARTKAAYLLGGYVAGSILDYGEAYAALEAAVARNTENLPAAMKTIDDCLHAGMEAAITIEDLEAERDTWIEEHRTMPLTRQSSSAYQRRLAARVARYKRQLYTDPYFGAPERRAKGIPVAVIIEKETSHV